MDWPFLLFSSSVLFFFFFSFARALATSPAKARPEVRRELSLCIPAASVARTSLSLHLFGSLPTICLPLHLSRPLCLSVREASLQRFAWRGSELEKRSMRSRHDFDHPRKNSSPCLLLFPSFSLALRPRIATSYLNGLFGAVRLPRTLLRDVCERRHFVLVVLGEFRR